MGKKQFISKHFKEELMRAHRFADNQKQDHSK